jgi:hypothetical protein
MESHRHRDPEHADHRDPHPHEPVKPAYVVVVGAMAIHRGFAAFLDDLLFRMVRTTTTTTTSGTAALTRMLTTATAITATTRMHIQMLR